MLKVIRHTTNHNLMSIAFNSAVKEAQNVLEKVAGRKRFSPGERQPSRQGPSEEMVLAITPLGFNRPVLMTRREAAQSGFAIID